MDKSATFYEVCKDGRDLFSAGMYRKAVSNFETALTAAPDEESMIDALFLIIGCYERLEEVSLAELVGLGRRADDFCSFSIWRFCVTVKSWSKCWYEYMANPRLRWLIF